MESNNSANNNLDESYHEENDSIWEILENLDNIESLPLQNVEVLHHNPELYRRHGAVPEGVTEAVLALTARGEAGAGGEDGDTGDEPVMMVNGSDDEEVDVGDDDGGWEQETEHINYMVGGDPDAMVDQLPLNQSAHSGGGDAESMFDPQLATPELSQQSSEMGEEYTDTDLMELASNTTSTVDGSSAFDQVTVMTLVEQYISQCDVITDVHEGRMIEILRLCDFIQDQLIILAAEIDTYKKNLNEQYVSLTALWLATALLSPETFEPDGDAA